MISTPPGRSLDPKAEQSGDAGMQVLVHVLARFQASGATNEKPFVVIQAKHSAKNRCSRSRGTRLHPGHRFRPQELITHNPVFADEIKMVLANSTTWMPWPISQLYSQSDHSQAR